VDITSPVAAEQTAHVLKVLGEIGAENTPQILVLNKSDRLNEPARTQDLPTLTHRLLGETARQNATGAVLISGQTGAGIDQLLELIDKQLVQDPVGRQRFRLPLGEGRALHLLHDRAAIISKHYEDHYCEVVADAPQSIRDRLAEFAVD
jgi:GTPase